MMKGKGLAKCFVLVLISLANMSAMSCPETMHNNKVSGEEEKSLANLSLLEEIGKFSKEAFHILSSDLKANGLETSEAYMHRTTSTLRGLLDDEILCNRTGLCSMKSVRKIKL
ncbi:hypothetical protein KSP40_PGU015383 [Platanthera guangdongensis]|uniref:Uncharacterized protein n=1 Tax=Platanthera guangdongensis TaxID=2320717 RepID=A0ABR2MB70_9ASPA